LIKIINLEELYKKQNELDKFIVDMNFNSIGDEMEIVQHNHIGFLNDRILALFTEVGEFANATKCFKYWSNKPAESKERLLDEYVDILHFYLSIGNTMQFSPVEVEAAYLKKYAENIDRQNRGDY